MGTGNDGTGLTLKSFKTGKRYHYGDYVFAKSSNSTSENHNSMWIAQKDFVAKTEPYNDTASGNWAEFQAPRGEKGEQGERGMRGATGTAGTQGQQGPRGLQGLQGPTGLQGLQGPSGANGKDGEKAIRGIREIREIRVL